MNTLKQFDSCVDCGGVLLDKRCINPDCEQFSILTYIRELQDKLKRRNTQIADLKNKVKERNKTINNCSICGEIMRQECINHKCKEFGKAVFKEITK